MCLCFHKFIYDVLQPSDFGKIFHKNAQQRQLRDFRFQNFQRACPGISYKFLAFSGLAASTPGAPPLSKSWLRLCSLVNNMRIPCIIEFFYHCIEQILQTLQRYNIQNYSKEQFLKVVIIFFQISIIFLALFLQKSVYVAFFQLNLV